MAIPGVALFQKGMLRSMNKSSANEESFEKRKKTLYIVLVFLVIVVIALVGVIMYLLGRASAGSNDEQMVSQKTEKDRGVVGESRMVLDEDSAANVLDEMRKQVEEGMFECSMSTEWTFQNGNAESRDAYVANTERNTHPFYFDVLLDGSDEVIYASPILPVGSTLTNFKLEKSLEAGTYEAVCQYHLIQDMDEQNVISSANFIVTIKILE